MAKKQLGRVTEPGVARRINGIVQGRRINLSGKTTDEVNELIRAYQAQSISLVTDAIATKNIKDKAALLRKAAHSMTRAAVAYSWVENGMCKDK